MGYPKAIRVDRGTEFVLRDLDLGVYTHSAVRDFSRPGEPTDNAFVESVSWRLRDDLLNETLLSTLGEAPELLVVWRGDFNRVRPQSALASRTPEEFSGHHRTLAATTGSVACCGVGLGSD